MRKRWFLPILALLLLMPWPVAYAYSNASAQSATTRIAVADAPSQPAWKAFSGMIGGVSEPHDLFDIDVTDNPVDLLATLYLTNADELVHSYRYMILKVGVYRQTATGWERAAQPDGSPLPETYITMQSGKVDFRLAGYARYRVTIDGGSFYCIKASTDGSVLAPAFYLNVE